MKSKNNSYYKKKHKSWKCLLNKRTKFGTFLDIFDKWKHRKGEEKVPKKTLKLIFVFDRKEFTLSIGRFLLQWLVRTCMFYFHFYDLDDDEREKTFYCLLRSLVWVSCNFWCTELVVKVWNTILPPTTLNVVKPQLPHFHPFFMTSAIKLVDHSHGNKWDGENHSSSV